MKFEATSICSLILLFTGLGCLIGRSEADTWRGFRGDGNSISTASNLPLQWSDEENVAWNHKLEGYGQSSPVVWQEHVYVTSALGDSKQTIRVDCFDLQSGKPLWNQSFQASQTAEKSKYISYAAPTPIADDKSIYAFFETGDVVAISHEGETQWQRSLVKDYGEFLGNHGVGSSIALSSKGLVILIDHGGPSYLLSLDPQTGKELWKVDREKRVSWSSPIITGEADNEKILISSNGVAEAYAANSGEKLWSVDGIEGNTVASPTVSENLIIVGSSAKDQSRALKLSNGEQVWTAEDAASSFGSPLIYKGLVYFVNRSGVAFCNDLQTGKLNWSHRLSTSTWASAVGAGDRIYFFSNNGVTTILEAGNAETAVEMGSGSLSTDDRLYGVAVVDGHLVFRMESKVVAVKNP